MSSLEQAASAAIAGGAKPARGPTLELGHVFVSFGETRALKDVSFSAPPRSAIALIGAAGSGKTTLLRAINRLHDLNPYARVTGSIKLDGADILDPGTDVNALRRSAAMIFPSPAMMPGNVADNVVFALRAQGVQDRRELEDACDRALRRALLWEYVSATDSLLKPAGALPYDLRQRLCFARALAVEPVILLLDEPTARMDPSATAGIEDIIARARRDCTILLATNDLQQAARLSDLTCFMAGGEVVEMGDTPTVFSRPANARTEDFLAGRAS